MPIDSVTVRLTKADRANLAAIADAMRANTHDPFVTRSTIVKTALHAAASDPAWLMRATGAATTSEAEARR